MSIESHCESQRSRGDHDWSNYADGRCCRLCGKKESRGSTQCWGGHDWCHGTDIRICRKCGLRVTHADEEAYRWRHR